MLVLASFHDVVPFMVLLVVLLVLSVSRCLLVVVNVFVVTVISGDGLVVFVVVIAAGVRITFCLYRCCCYCSRDWPLLLFQFFSLSLFSRGSRSSFKCGILVRYAQALIVGVRCLQKKRSLVISLSFTMPPDPPHFNVESAVRGVGPVCENNARFC